MAQRIETITQHVFAFDDGEIARIIDALYDAGEDELAGEIMSELHSVDGVCECERDWEAECDKADKEAYDSFQEDAKANRQTEIKVNGGIYFKDFVGDIIQEIYAQSKDGRVIIERGL